MTAMPNAAGWTGQPNDQHDAARRVSPDGAGSRAERPGTERRMARLVALANLMDSSISIPGTKIKVGLDPIIGLIPGIGDALTAAISLYIVHEAWKIGATKKQLAAMLGNVVVDMALGAIPIAGDVADFAFKANVRNLKIMGITPRGVKIEFDPGAGFRR